MDDTLTWLIQYLLKEKKEYRHIQMPKTRSEKFQLYRSLVNLRYPASIDQNYLEKEDAFLKEECLRKGIVTLFDMNCIYPHIYLWQGDITRLQVDAIVNAANEKMLGCFVPCHGCIDNAIHTYAGMRLRLKCYDIMQQKQHDEEVGNAIITEAFNLPCKYVIHTVGPFVETIQLQPRHRKQLASCYESILQKAYDNHLSSIALCCISTGEYHFPNEEAANIAVDCVMKFMKQHPINVIFNVYKDEDLAIYTKLLKEKLNGKGN